MSKTAFIECPLLIQGFFFQVREGFGISMESGEAQATIQANLFQFMFAGMIWPDPEHEIILIGNMMDELGFATLSRIAFIPNKRLRFVKTYDCGPHVFPITYDLIKEKDVPYWTGKYCLSGPQGKMEGDVNCFITEAPKDFFIPVTGTSIESYLTYKNR